MTGVKMTTMCVQQGSISSHIRSWAFRSDRPECESLPGLSLTCPRVHMLSCELRAEVRLTSQLFKRMKAHRTRHSPRWSPQSTRTNERHPLGIFTRTHQTQVFRDQSAQRLQGFRLLTGSRARGGQVGEEAWKRDVLVCGV